MAADDKFTTLWPCGTLSFSVCDKQASKWLLIANFYDPGKCTSFVRDF